MYSIGIDIGGTSVKAGLVSVDGRILAEERSPAIPREPLSETFRRLRQCIEKMTRNAHVPYPPKEGIGIGFAGIVDHRTGWLKLSGSLSLEGCNLRGIAESALECPVVVDCDSNAGALADLYWGQAREATNVLYITWGTGIGAGLIIGRRLYRSLGASMGEIGHTLVEWENPRPCYCGCSGCLEAEATGRAIEKQVSELFGRSMTTEEIARASRQGVTQCQELLKRAARLLARALAGALVLLNPDLVVLGGGVSLCLPQVRADFDEEMEKRAPSFALRTVQIVLSDFPARAGLLGAAMLPRHEAEKES